MKLLIQLLIVTLGLGLASCSTKVPATSALESGHWRKVKDKPPTYYPLGVKKDHQTGASHGYWIDSGNANGTRFFVPVRNTKWPSADLIAEAQAAMTPEAKAGLTGKRIQARGMNAAGKTVEVVSKTMYGILQVLGSR